jgi:WD40 repeat protein
MFSRSTRSVLLLGWLISAMDSSECKSQTALARKVSEGSRVGVQVAWLKRVQSHEIDDCGAIHKIAFADSGATLCVCPRRGPVQELDSSSLKLKAKLASPGDELTLWSIAKLTSERYAIGGTGSRATIVNRGTQTEALDLGVAAKVRYSLQFSDDGKYLGIGELNQLCILNVTTGKRIEVADPDVGRLTAICFSPDNKSVFTGGTDRMVKRWGNAATLQPNSTQPSTCSNPQQNCRSWIGFGASRTSTGMRCRDNCRFRKR